MPVTVPRRCLSTVLPSTSLLATEVTPLPRANRDRAASTPQPASAPSRVAATSAMARMAPACTRLPTIQKPLRTGCSLIHWPTASCGSRDRDSRRGTSHATMKAGAPRAASSQVSVSFASTRLSPILVRVRETRCTMRLRGCSRQACSGISLQVLASSSGSSSCAISIMRLVAQQSEG